MNESPRQNTAKRILNFTISGLVALTAVVKDNPEAMQYISETKREIADCFAGVVDKTVPPIFKASEAITPVLNSSLANAEAVNANAKTPLM